MTEAAQVQKISTKREKFIQLAERRMSNAIKRIELVGNLANRASYEYSEFDARKIVAALESAVEQVKMKMSGSAKSQTSFRL